MTLKRWGPILMILSLVAVIAIPTMADYLGPNRTVTTYVWKRLHCHYQAIYDPPGAGWYGCYLDLYQTPDSTCPSTSSVIPYFSAKDCGWPSDYCQDPGCSITLSSSKEDCSEGQTGCRATETTVTHPPATVSGSLVCTSPGNNGWCCGDGQLELSGTEPLSGYSILVLEGTRNGETFACPGDSCSVPLVEGTNDFTFWVLSSWGDSSLMGTASGKLDSNPPVISGEWTGTAGENGWYLSEVTVAASASDAVSGLATFEMALDGGGWAAYDAPFTLSDGIHTMDFRAVDAAGNVSTQTQGVRIDTQPPTLTLDAGASFCPGCGQTLRITIDIQDPGSGVTSWTLSADGAAIKSGSGPSSETLTWNGAGLSAGGHTLLLQARDEAGNGSDASHGLTLVAPTQPPPPPPTSAPSKPGDAAPEETAILTATPTPTSSEIDDDSLAPTPTISHKPTRTSSTFFFGGPPAAPPDEGSMESLSGPDSSSGESLNVPEGTAGVGTSNVLWGIGAAALVAAATAAALERARRRKEAEAREREEMARRNAQAEAREEAERQRQAAQAAAYQEAELRLEELMDRQDAEQMRQEAIAARHETWQQHHAEVLEEARQEAELQRQAALAAAAAVAAAAAAAESERREANLRKLERNKSAPVAATPTNQPQGITNPQVASGVQGTGPALVSEETISETTEKAGTLANLLRKAKGVWNANGIAFNELVDGKISVSAPKIPAGEKLQFRLDQYIPGTRYNPATLAFTTAKSLFWKAAKGIGASLGVSIGVNLIDYGFGEHSDKGIISNEFLASTLVDIGVAGLTGLAAAGIVGIVISAASITAPLAAAVAATAIVGIGLGWVIDQIFDIDPFKQQVANGFSAWGGIFENTQTIFRVGTDRVMETVKNVTDQVVNTGKQAIGTISETVTDLADKVSESASKVVETTKDTLQQAGQSISNSIEEATSAVSEFLGDLFRKVK